jgi:hypothetical protein
MSSTIGVHPSSLAPANFPPDAPLPWAPFTKQIGRQITIHLYGVRYTGNGNFHSPHPFRPRNRARMPRAVQLPAGQPLNAFFMTRRVVSWRAGRAEANRRWRSESILIPPPPSEAPDREMVEGKTIPGRARVILTGASSTTPPRRASQSACVCHAFIKPCLDHTTNDPRSSACTHTATKPRAGCGCGLWVPGFRPES